MPNVDAWYFYAEFRYGACRGDMLSRQKIRKLTCLNATTTFLVSASFLKCFRKTLKSSSSRFKRRSSCGVFDDAVVSVDAGVEVVANFDEPNSNNITGQPLNTGWGT